MMGNNVGEILGVILILIIIFLVIREVICWYWKINQNIALLAEIRDLLKQQNGGSEIYAAPATETNASSPASASSATRSKKSERTEDIKTPCEYCNNMKPYEDLDMYNGKYICPDCISKYHK